MAWKLEITSTAVLTVRGLPLRRMSKIELPEAFSSRASYARVSVCRKTAGFDSAAKALASLEAEDLDPVGIIR